MRNVNESQDKIKHSTNCLHMVLDAIPIGHGRRGCRDGVKKHSEGEKRVMREEILRDLPRLPTYDDSLFGRWIFYNFLYL